jgi:TadE-like protein
MEIIFNNQIFNKKKEIGQSMVELAFSITFLMVLLAGTIDLGRAFFTWLALRDAAQEGASYGSVYPSRVDLIKYRVWDNLGQVINNPQTNVSVTVGYIDHPCLGNTILVSVDYPDFPLTMPFLGTIVGSQTISIHATVNDSILKPMVCP